MDIPCIIAHIFLEDFYSNLKYVSHVRYIIYIQTHYSVKSMYIETIVFLNTFFNFVEVKKISSYFADTQKNWDALSYKILKRMADLYPNCVLTSLISQKLKVTTAHQGPFSGRYRHMCVYRDLYLYILYGIDWILKITRYQKHYNSQMRKLIAWIYLYD